MLRSALALTGHHGDVADARAWLAQQREHVALQVERVPFAALGEWSLGADGRLAHRSGRFFSIEGIGVETTWGPVAEWDQPIIRQPEVGILGLLCREWDGVPHFLVQAKCEPGNLDDVQLSPTLQATRSNYTRVHGGGTPAYLDDFLRAERRAVVLDQLQSEQGSRFLAKRNRNVIVETRADVPLRDGYRWLTLGQIKALLREPNVVNMDTRTVIAGLSYEDPDGEGAAVDASRVADPTARGLLRSSLRSGVAYARTAEVHSWITGLRASHELRVRPRSLRALRGWVVSDDEIFHETRRHFRVIGASVAVEGREVRRWSQPFIESIGEGLFAFIVKAIDGVLHFLVQAIVEAGHRDVVELAPTVQCCPDDAPATVAEGRAAFLDAVLHARPEQILYDVRQSEEGGRFYREQNRNMLVLADPDFPLDCGEGHLWMTLHQLLHFVQFTNCLNIQARGLLSAVAFA